MKRAILADVHGNAPALAAVLADIDDRGISQIDSLGDVAGYGCLINECIDILRERAIPNLLGNHDFYLLENDAVCPRSQSATKCLEYQQKVLLPQHAQWLKTSPTIRQTEELSFVHAGWSDHLEEYLYTVPDDYFRHHSHRCFFAGHTHVQGMKRFSDGKIFVNPGSVGQPRDGNWHAAYAIWEDGEIQLVRVPYDLERIEHAMVQAGFEPYFFEHLRVGTRIGGKVDVWND